MTRCLNSGLLRHHRPWSLDRVDVWFQGRQLVKERSEGGGEEEDRSAAVALALLEEEAGAGDLCVGEVLATLGEMTDLPVPAMPRGRKTQFPSGSLIHF